VKLLPSASPLPFPHDDIVYGQSLSRGFTVTLSPSLCTVFHSPCLTMCTVGNPLTMLMGRSQSWVIRKVVAPVAQHSGIELSPESPVWYGWHSRKIMISCLSPSLVVLCLGLPLHLALLRFGRLAPYCLLSLAGTLLLSLLGLCSLMLVSSWDLAWLRACCRNSLIPMAFMLPPLSITGHALPPVRFLVGLWSLRCPAIHFLCVGLDSDLPLGFACPFSQAAYPGYLAPSCMPSRP